MDGEFASMGLGELLAELDGVADDDKVVVGAGDVEE